MAKLDTQTIPGPWDNGIDADWEAHFKAESAALQELRERAASLPEGEVVGAFLSFPVADGFAHYVVTKARPLTVAHVPFGDGYRVAPMMIRGMRKSDVLAMVKRERAYARLFAQGSNR